MQFWNSCDLIGAKFKLERKIRGRRFKEMTEINGAVKERRIKLSIFPSKFVGLSSNFYTSLKHKDK